jgi:hypothetical protein
MKENEKETLKMLTESLERHFIFSGLKCPFSGPLEMELGIFYQKALDEMCNKLGLKGELSVREGRLFFTFSSRSL